MFRITTAEQISIGRKEKKNKSPVLIEYVWRFGDSKWKYYFRKLYGLLNINSIKSPGCGSNPQKNDSPEYARCMVCPL